MFSCNSKKQIGGYYSYETECLGVELDGSQTLRSWGSGRNRSDAIEQAKKNAVRDVLFKGIRKGNSECSLKPVLIDANVYEKNAEYFNHFFQDDGDYSKYITGEDGSDIHISVLKERTQAKDQEMYTVVIRVQRALLIKKMINDKIKK